MADYVEKWGDDIDSAVELALKDLKLTRDEVTVTVLEQPSKGFLGLFGSRLAKVRVEKKSDELKKLVAKESKNAERIERKAQQNNQNQKKDRPAPEKKEKPAARPAQPAGAGAAGGSGFGSLADIDGNSSSASAAGIEAADMTSAEAAGAGEAQAVSENEERRQGGRSRSRRSGHGRDRGPQMHTKFTITDEDTDAVPIEDAAAVKFIDEMAKNMGLTITMKAAVKDETLFIELEGEDVGTLIGKRGQTLDAVQYLASIVQNKDAEQHLRVIINAEMYREKREKTLQQLARRLSDKCVRSGKNVRLEPMNPYERKVIHSTLQNHPKVTTRSEGSEPNRRVIIELKK